MSHYLKSSYEYTKTRRTFGREPLFETVPARILSSIYPDRSLQKKYILRNPVHREAQAVVTQSQHDCNTPIKKYHNLGVRHEEGGWPKDVPWQSEELASRHRRRIMHEDNYIQAVLNTAPAITHCLEQNNAVEMYRTYFTEMPRQESIETQSIQLSNVFRDQWNRPISCIDWTSEKDSKIVVSHYPCTDPNLNKFDIQSLISTFGPGGNILVWDINDEGGAICELEAESTCYRLACCYGEPDVIAAGLEDGRVSIFDIRGGVKAVAKSSEYTCHNAPVTGIHYFHTRSNTEFFTASPDGQVLWWDTRNLENPTESVPISVKLQPKELPSLSNAVGASTLQYDRNIPTKYLIGTENGLVISGNRMGKTHNEKMILYGTAHCGPVRAIDRSPCLGRIYMTCGDYTVNIWSEEVRTAPIIFFNPYKYEVTDALWAPLRFSSFMSICEGGVIYYWDLLRRHRDPIATLQVSKNPLMKLSCHESGEIVAVGDGQGSTYLLKLSESMVQPDNQNKALMFKVFERETLRERILDIRQKEIGLKRRQEEEEEAAKARLEEEPEVVEEEDIDRQTEEYYFSKVNEELARMGMDSDVP